VRALTLATIFIGLGLLSTSDASAFPMRALPVRDAAAAHSPAIEANFYYQGRYYRYRYRGHYYNYRYHGRYYRYYYGGRYYNNRNCGWLPSHHYRCNYW